MSAPVAFPSGNGRHHTHALTVKGKPNTRYGAGQPYPAVTLDRVRAMVENPLSLDSDNALWFIPSSYGEHDARCHDTQRERGVFHCLPVDIDCNDLPLDDVQEAVRAVIGDAVALYYSTRSAKPYDKRWRVLIPLAKPISGGEYHDTQNALFDLLEEASGGVLLPDRALTRPGQLVYLPNKGTSGFYEYALPDASAPVLELTPDCAIMVRRKANAEARRQAEQEAKAAAERRAAKRKSDVAGDGLSPVAHFNAAHCVADLLARYGYERDGRSNDWRSPFQTSGSYATRDYGDYWLSLSGSDASAGIGAQTRSGHRHGDAFDLYCHFEHGGDFTAAVRAYAQEIDLDTINTLDAFQTLDSATQGQEAQASEAKPSKAFRFVQACDLEYSAPEFLIDGLIETETLGLLFGDPGHGKSFVALELALCIATGTPFHGRAVKQGPVFVIVGEGLNGVKRRIAAWEKHHAVSLKDAPLFLSNRPAQFLDKASAREVTQAVHAMAAQHGDPAMIEIDTLARNFGPGDENQTSEMGQFIAAIDDLKAEFPGCAALIVHHTGHSDKQRARGAMALKGALDCEYRVEKNRAVIKLINTKMKDAEPPKNIAFELQTVELEGGASSAVLAECDEAENFKPLTQNQKLALDAFCEAAALSVHFADDGEFLGLPLDEWREVFYKWHTGDTTEAKKKAFQRARKDLIATARLEVESDIYRPTDIGDMLTITHRRKSGTSGTDRDNVPTSPDAEAA